MSIRSLTPLAAHTSTEHSPTDQSTPSLEEATSDDFWDAGRARSAWTLSPGERVSVTGGSPLDSARGRQALPPEIREIADRFDRFVKQADEIRSCVESIARIVACALGRASS